MPKTAKCDCGCGQAPAATTRLRKAVCPDCDAVIRLSRSVIEDALPYCGRCATAYRPACLYDAELVDQVADHPVWLAERARIDHAAPVSRGQEFCADCGAFKASRDPCNGRAGTCGNTDAPVSVRPQWRDPARAAMTRKTFGDRGSIGTRKPMRTYQRKYRAKPSPANPSPAKTEMPF